jgi:DNA polymerase-3 subunit epsilon
MKKDVFLAVEATGLATDTDRLVEIVALEAVNSKLTGRQFHALLNPEHPIEFDAELAIGYDNDQLAWLPTFSEMAPAFLNFVNGANVIVFNANWTLTLVDAELERRNLSPLSLHVNRLKDARSLAINLDLNCRSSLDDLLLLFFCREPVQACSKTWRDCFMLSQLFPRLATGNDINGMNIVQLEISVPVIDGPFGTQQIEIADIAEPWRSQFLRWLCGGELSGSEHIQRCHQHHWTEWLTLAPALCPELAPSQLQEFPFVWSDVRWAMRQGQRRAQHHLDGKCVRYRDDLEREMLYQAALATYGAQEKTLQQAYIRGFRKGLKNVKRS